MDDTQCFEYSDEIEEDEGICDERQGTGDDCTELRALLLFLLLWQSVFKVADRAIIVLIKFFKIFLTSIGKILQAETLLNFAKIIPETLYMKRNLGFKRTASSNMQFALNAKPYITSTNAFAANQTVKVCQRSAVMLAFLVTHGRQADGHVERCL